MVVREIKIKENLTF